MPFTTLTSQACCPTGYLPPPPRLAVPVSQPDHPFIKISHEYLPVWTRSCCSRLPLLLTARCHVCFGHLSPCVCGEELGKGWIWLPGIQLETKEVKSMVRWESEADSRRLYLEERWGGGQPHVLTEQSCPGMWYV